MQKQLGGLSSFVKLKLGLESCTQNLRNIVLTDGKWTGFFFTDLPCTTQERWGVVGLHHRTLEECSSQLEYNLVLLFTKSPALITAQLPISARNKAVILTDVLYCTAHPQIRPLLCIKYNTEK